MIHNHVPKPYRDSKAIPLLYLSLLLFFMTPAYTLRVAVNGTIAGYSVSRINWAALVLGFLWLFLLIAYSHRRTVKFRKTLSDAIANGGCLCWSCGYDLRGHAEDVLCPECGSNVAESRQHCNALLTKGYMRQWWRLGGRGLDVVWVSCVVGCLIGLVTGFFAMRTLDASLAESERLIAKEETDFNAMLAEAGYKTLPTTAAPSVANRSKWNAPSFQLLMAFLFGGLVAGRVVSWWLAFRIDKCLHTALASGDLLCWYCGLILHEHGNGNEATCSGCGILVRDTRKKYTRWLDRPLWRRIVLT